MHLRPPGCTHGSGGGREFVFGTEGSVSRTVAAGALLCIASGTVRIQRKIYFRMQSRPGGPPCGGEGRGGGGVSLGAGGWGGCVYPKGRLRSGVRVATISVRQRNRRPFVHAAK